MEPILDGNYKNEPKTRLVIPNTHGFKGLILFVQILLFVIFLIGGYFVIQSWPNAGVIVGGGAFSLMAVSLIQPFLLLSGGKEKRKFFFIDLFGALSFSLFILGAYWIMNRLDAYLALRIGALLSAVAYVLRALPYFRDEAYEGIKVHYLMMMLFFASTIVLFGFRGAMFFPQLELLGGESIAMPMIGSFMPPILFVSLAAFIVIGLALNTILFYRKLSYSPITYEGFKFTFVKAVIFIVILIYAILIVTRVLPRELSFLTF